MAQKVQVLLVDDLEGGEADETVTFALDGVAYEIDLTHANAGKLRELLAPYTDKGRKQSGRLAGGRGRGRAAAARPVGGNPDTAKMRAWAKEQGFEVNERGRVPSNIREEYEKAHS
ncbi:histone-like nucleoid-structuring protein Lsr2 [Streptacidiphilus rugosus]|uniref:histone-like nucleoid-structuring protein Lsr2 n=1 Tax=Streptacidiphilus rugosus TaxID=405783 RepID=UPI0005674CFA|nr:Lsr2 family protein [Streptacidiphilus rugosus]